MKMIRKVILRFFTVPEGERSNLSVVLWWELRRIPYNLIVGLFAVASWMIAALSIELANFAISLELLPLIGAFFLANFFYTGGWVTEITVRMLTKRQARNVGTALFTAGFLFSSIIVWAPAAAWGTTAILFGDTSAIERPEVVGRYVANYDDTDILVLMENGTYEHEFRPEPKGGGGSVMQSGIWELKRDEGKAYIMLVDFQASYPHGSGLAGFYYTSLGRSISGQVRLVISYDSDYHYDKEEG